MRVRFIDAGGFRTRVLHEGSGHPVLMIHGLGTTAERWIHNIDPLAARFACHAPDLLASGFSDNAAFEVAPQFRHLAQLKALVEALSFERFSVIGSSYGGLLAALLVLALPGRIHRLVVVGSGSAFHPAEEQRKVLEAARQNALTALEEGTLEATRRRMARIVHRPESIPESALMVQLTANSLPGRDEAAKALYSAMVPALAVPEAQVIHRLEEIRVPTLIVTGRDDPRASVARAEAASRRIPDCRLEIFEECGHGPMLEHPERFNRVVEAFLRDGLA